MIRELLLLRHGKAELLAPQNHTTSGHAGGDFARELHDKGKRNAQRIGLWMAQNDLKPDHIISSPAIRAKRTAQKSCKTAGLNSDMVFLDKRVYQARTDDLIKVIQSAPATAKRLLLVGHNPGLESLVRVISSEQLPRSGKAASLSPASLAHFSFTGEWSEFRKGCAQRLEIIRPKQLPRTFPFPNMYSVEQRPRPAYYYSQSSVVPYRMHDGKLEVLIILSSKKKHWVIPKGIHDPGMSAEDSAANEAFEEAGIIGEVSEEVIGSYQAPKWDFFCTIQVHPMKVTRELPEDEWPERHRTRQWVTVETASDMVMNDEVKKIIAKLPAFLKQQG